jgi:8-oxo-dGTP pyrophosphatase MutT (NUDIX family)
VNQVPANQVPAPPVRAPGTPATRPKEAATLIIHRGKGANIEVLMGERHRKHRFMPHNWVFPGGRIDPTDARIPAGAGLRPDVATQLQRKLSRARAHATAIAAVRETFEETGLVIGVPDPAPRRRAPRNWGAFFGTGMAPALDNLEYIARAVTPPIRPLRYNARFFMIHTRHVIGDLAGSGELMDLKWFPIAEARELKMPMITRKILFHIEDLINDPPPPNPDRPIPYFKHMGDYHKRIDE